METKTVVMKIETIPTTPDMIHSHVTSVALDEEGKKIIENNKLCIHELSNDHYEIMNSMIELSESYCKRMGFDFKLKQLV